MQHPLAEIQATLEHLDPQLREEYLPGAIEAHVVNGIGLTLDSEMRRILRVIVRASLDTKRVHEVARRLYTCRRVLNRRFYSRGLPVASHWLHVCRLVRATIMLRSPERPSVFDVAMRCGYNAAGELSSQMLRLTGLRPSQVRTLPRWQDVLDAWIDTEIAASVAPAAQTAH